MLFIVGMHRNKALNIDMKIVSFFKEGKKSFGDASVFAKESFAFGKKFKTSYRNVI